MRLVNNELEKDVGGGSHGLLRGTMPAFAWSD
jgi:hypothetical protein